MGSETEKKARQFLKVEQELEDAWGRGLITQVHFDKALQARHEELMSLDPPVSE